MSEEESFQWAPLPHITARRSTMATQWSPVFSWIQHSRPASNGQIPGHLYRLCRCACGSIQRGRTPGCTVQRQTGSEQLPARRWQCPRSTRHRAPSAPLGSRPVAMAHPPAITAHPRTLSPGQRRWKPKVPDPGYEISGESWQLQPLTIFCRVQNELGPGTFR